MGIELETYLKVLNEHSMRNTVLSTFSEIPRVNKKVIMVTTLNLVGEELVPDTNFVVYNDGAIVRETDSMRNAIIEYENI